MSNLDWDKLNKQKNALEEKLSKGGGGARAKFWKPDDGLNRIRVMPGWADSGNFAGQFWREVAQHWRVSDDQKGPVLCPKYTPYLEGPCPICELVAELKLDKSNEAAQSVVKDIRPKTAFLLNVVDASDKTYTAADVAEFKKARPGDDVPFEVGDVKVQVYACPSTVFNQILSTIQVNEVDVTDLESGRDITIKKTGKGLQTRYETNIIIKPSSAPEVETLPALDDVGFQMSYDEMLKLLSEGVGSAFASTLPRGGASTAPALTAPAPAPASEEGLSADDLRAQMAAAVNS